MLGNPAITNYIPWWLLLFRVEVVIFMAAKTTPEFIDFSNQTVERPVKPFADLRVKE